MPIARLAGGAIAWSTRTRAADGTRAWRRAPLTAACIVYLVTGGLTLSRVLPQL